MQNRKAIQDAEVEYDKARLKPIEDRMKLLEEERKLLSDTQFKKQQENLEQQIIEDELYIKQLLENQYTTKEDLIAAEEKLFEHRKAYLEQEKKILEY